MLLINVTLWRLSVSAQECDFCLLVFIISPLSLPVSGECILFL